MRDLEPALDVRPRVNPAVPLRDRVARVGSALRKASARLSPPGLVFGCLFFAASITPSLVPRTALLQGVLGGLSFAAGYASGHLLVLLWRFLQLPLPQALARTALIWSALGLSVLAVAVMSWRAVGLQNRQRALLGMAELEAWHGLTLYGVALAVVLLMWALVRLFGALRRRTAGLFAQRLPPRQAALLGMIVAAGLFYAIGKGVLANRVMMLFDATYAELDQRLEPDRPRPTASTRTGGPGSLIAWESLGRMGRRMVTAAPDQRLIEHATGQRALEPLRVYVGLASAASPRERARLALAELRRVGAFDRSALVIATPTGTGWIDEHGQGALEYLLAGDVATVGVQYSYLPSWLALLADPDYGVETAREVFAAVYSAWRALPRERRPKLYLWGLSLGAHYSDASHDLFQIVGDPYQGALWVGPPFVARTWRNATAERNADSPVWAPTFRDGSVIRFTTQTNRLDTAQAEWGPMRIIFLQYASDAITFFDPQSVWRPPAWMTSPRGPDVDPALRWVPVVSFLQGVIDLMTAVTPPVGHGHSYAFEHYLDAWLALTDAPGWTPERIQRIKSEAAPNRDAARP